MAGEAPFINRYSIPAIKIIDQTLDGGRSHQIMEMPKKYYVPRLNDKLELVSVLNEQRSAAPTYSFTDAGLKALLDDVIADVAAQNVVAQQEIPLLNRIRNGEKIRIPQANDIP